MAALGDRVPTSTMTPIEFRDLRARLDAPPRVVISPDALLESFCPHAPAPAAGWPEPEGAAEVEGILRALPHRQKGICALTAAEMVLPLWEAWAVANNRPEVALPVRSVAGVRQWIAGNPLPFGIPAMVKSLRGIRGLPIHLQRIVDSIASLLLACGSGSLDEARFCVTSAGQALAYWPTRIRRRFYRRWWEICRCRLAFRDAATAELQ